VYVPNGKLADMVVDNYGLRVYRRFSTKLTIAYGTPTPLISKFVEGLRQIVERHPNTRKDYYHIYLNELGSHSYDILFYVFFAVPSWAEELRARHEVLMAAIDLAHELGVQFAFPTQTLHVETFPEKAGNTPTYDTSPEAMDKRMNDFFEQFENKYKGNGAS
jgi:MscS family membrane protein